MGENPTVTNSAVTANPDIPVRALDKASSGLATQVVALDVGEWGAVTGAADDVVRAVHSVDDEVEIVFVMALLMED